MIFVPGPRLDHQILVPFANSAVEFSGLAWSLDIGPAQAGLAIAWTKLSGA